MADIGELLQNVFQSILMPMRWLMEGVGLHPADIQVWTMMVAIFMVAILAPTTYGDMVLRRRQQRTTGTVVSIDERDDIATPRIGFRDSSGRQIEFDSPMSLNRHTRAVGGAVEVIYDPLHPQRAREANRVLGRIFTATVWYGIAIALFVFSVLDLGPMPFN